MELSTLTQKAGDNSSLVQAHNAIINNYCGITEERAREIFKELSADTYAKYTQESYATIDERLEKFKNELLMHFAQYENILKAFSDPEFQFLLKKAQLRAAITDQESDYTTLANFLVMHIQKGKNRKVKTAIRHAIDIVDEIDNDALCALTIAHVIQNMEPISLSCISSIKFLSDLFQKLLYMELPNGFEWLDHLETLGTIKTFPLNSLRSLIDYYIKKFDGYICVGIKENSPEHKKALQFLASTSLSEQLLQPNELFSGYVRLSVTRKVHLSIHNNIGIQNITHPLTEDECHVLLQIWDLYSKDPILQKEVNTRFTTFWLSFPSLNQLSRWWTKIPYMFSITSVGRVLAYTNSKQHVPEIPDLL